MTYSDAQDAHEADVADDYIRLLRAERDAARDELSAVLDRLRAEVEQWREESEGMQAANRAGSWVSNDRRSTEAYDRATVELWTYQRFIDLLDGAREPDMEVTT